MRSLLPDTSHGAGIGTDNMTFLVVAILGGRTKEEWYDRVKQNYGYETPTAHPGLYAEIKAREEARAEREAMEEWMRIDSDDSAGDLTPKLSAINIDQ